MSEYNLPIYHDPKRYDDEYWWKKDDIEFWKNHYKKINVTSVLEIACGTGRLGIPIIREGAVYSGLDISQEFIDTMKIKIQKNKLQGEIIKADMRSFDLNKKFDFIFIGFNSLLHLLTDGDLVKFLACVKNHCHSNTMFSIDIFVPHPLFLYRPNKRYPAMEYVDSETNKLITVEEISDYNPETGINAITWFYSSENNKDIVRYNFNMRMIYPDTMTKQLNDAGFKIVGMYGDYDYNKFNEYSQYQIYDCIIQ